MSPKDFCYSPAAKCNGVDLRPAVSRALTVCGVISFFTLAISPVLQASKSSRNGSLAMTVSRLTFNIARLRLVIVISVVVVSAVAVVNLDHAASLLDFCFVYTQRN